MKNKKRKLILALLAVLIDIRIWADAAFCRENLRQKAKPRPETETETETETDN